KSAVLIAGPTASGESGFAMALAKSINGVIVNADSMQVYDGLQVLTARPSVEDEASLPHRLYGHVPADIRYSVGAWLRDVEPVLAQIWADNKCPIIVGGTGLYFRALTEGLAETPEISPKNHESFIAQHSDMTSSQLHDILSIQDAEAAQKLETNDRQRILRALMVLELTGQSLSDWQRRGNSNAILPLEQTVYRVFIPADRTWLYERIENRFLAMLQNGGEAEARALLERQLPQKLPVMNAIGMPWFHALHIANSISDHDYAVEKSIRDTRRYAKRQLTWFRNQMADWPSLDPQQWEADSAKMQTDLAQIITELDNQA
ncbi:MAG: tRNA (adenosine(37)-N6)-dimethylallyltransferase MiaA, partial [Rhizobiales bacterium]|nr:tRNA (adenosine(37)-N6)-dimethylallyltransferase MiaA [Hyphomicrobiales bacterium]